MFLPPGHAELKPHPFANLIPPMKDVDRTALGESIAASGQINPIMLHRGMILDGRHRYAECARLGKGVRADNFDGDDRAALEYVLGANLARRHLDETERARVANNLARMRVGVNQHTIAAQRERAAATELPLPKGVIPGRAEGASVPAQAGKPMRPEGEAGASIEPPVVMGFPTTTLDEPSAGEPDEAIEVGTCECGEVFRTPQSRHAEMDALCEAHWRTFDHVAERVDDRGRPLSPAELARLDPAQLYRQIAEVAPDAAEPPVAIDMAPVSQAEAAALLNVSRRTVQNVAAVDARGAPELQQALADGRVKASAAAEIAQLPIEEQRAIIASADPEAVRKVARDNREKKREASRERKLEGLRKINEAAPLVTGRRYAVVYADPPWRFEPYSRATGDEKSPDNHYPTMDLDAIKALPVGEIAHADCALFLWATVPMLPEALAVMAAWGFTYKSHVVWDKEKSGTGFWFRNRHELLLLGTRGDVPCGIASYPSLIAASGGKHSEKPLSFVNMIEHMFPGVPSIELFARGNARPGWDVWGNQAQAADADVRPPFLRARDAQPEAAE